jgi:AmmeMemoRadiSam system protein A
MLLAAARAAVRAAAAGAEPPPPPAELPPRLGSPAGAFVSLHVRTELRGCVGSIVSEEPLAATVMRMAVAAATRDPRFPPVTPAELPDLHLEVSVLSPVRYVSVEDVDPARHGIAFQLHHRRAVLLPQVAARRGWDRPTLLAALCDKAGLPPGAWRHPDVVLRAFTVVVIEGALEPRDDG